MFKGRPGFVIGGGDSLRGFPWPALRGRVTIGVNMAYKVSPTITLIQDKGLIEAIYTSGSIQRFHWHKSSTIGIFLTAMKAVHYYQFYQAHFCEGILWPDTLEEGLPAKSNTGVSAVALADVLGCDPIYLLGFDMQPPQNGNKVPHWHDDYAGKFQTNTAALKNWISDFEGCVAVQTRKRKQVINLSPVSALKCFPYQNVSSVLPVGNFQEAGKEWTSISLDATD
jgi:hypothetical protein